jgi:hypothetical protein
MIEKKTSPSKPLELTPEQLARARELLVAEQTAKQKEIDARIAACKAEIDAVLEKYGCAFHIDANPSMQIIPREMIRQSANAEGFPPPPPVKFIPAAKKSRPRHKPALPAPTSKPA